MAVPGTVERHPANPLFTGTEPWEHNINNGYSNVIYDANNTLAHGAYRVYYTASDSAFSGSIPHESDGSALLYARSDDGITFEKPSLHLNSFHNSTANNILIEGTTSVAVYDDGWHDRNPAARSRFKVWGDLGVLDVTCEPRG